KMRAEEMARLRGSNADQRSSMRQAMSRSYMRNVVEKFSLQKAFADEGTIEALARAGYRGQGPLTTYLFLRFATPIALFFLAFGYLSLTVFAGKPLYLNALYALMIGLVGAYLPVLVLKNRTLKRQASVRR